MARPLIIFLLFFYSNTLFSGNGDSLTLIIPTEQIAFFTVDYHGNIYVVKKSNEVSCYTKKGELKFSYRSQHRNRIRSMDASNPLKLLLFYEGVPEAVFLDNYLTETNSLKFMELGFQEVSAICMSSDNKLWLYDALENSICKIDPDNRKVVSRNRLTLQGIDPISEISDFKEYRNNLYLNNTGKEVVEFDFLGNKRKRFSIPISGNVSFTGDSLIFLRNDSVIFYNFVDYSIYKKPIDTKVHSENIKKIVLSNGKIYFLKNNGIYY